MWRRLRWVAGTGGAGLPLGDAVVHHSGQELAKAFDAVGFRPATARPVFCGGTAPPGTIGRRRLGQPGGAQAAVDQCVDGYPASNSTDQTALRGMGGEEQPLILQPPFHAMVKPDCGMSREDQPERSDQDRGSRGGCGGRQDQRGQTEAAEAAQPEARRNAAEAAKARRGAAGRAARRGRCPRFWRRWAWSPRRGGPGPPVLLAQGFIRRCSVAARGGPAGGWGSGRALTAAGLWRSAGHEHAGSTSATDVHGTDWALRSGAALGRAGMGRTTIRCSRARPTGTSCATSSKIRCSGQRLAPIRRHWPTSSRWRARWMIGPHGRRRCRFPPTRSSGCPAASGPRGTACASTCSLADGEWHLKSMTVSPGRRD